MKQAVGLVFGAVLLLSTGAAGQSDVPAPWNADETITIANGASPGVIVMSNGDFCRAMAFLLMLYQDEAAPSEEQLARCTSVISEQMVTQAWIPEVWQRLMESPSTATPAAPTPAQSGRMTMEAAGAYYLDAVRRYNLANSRWGCAAEKSKNGLSWKQSQKWAKRTYQADKRWMRALRAADWPKSVAKKFDRLLDKNATSMLWDKRVFNHKSALAAALSGASAKRTKANSASSEAAQQVRLALGLPAVPDAGSDCKQVKRLEKLLNG